MFCRGQDFLYLCSPPHHHNKHTQTTGTTVLPSQNQSRQVTCAFSKPGWEFCFRVPFLAANMDGAANVMLIIVLVVMMFILLACVGLLIIKFSHPNDKNQAKFPKAIVTLGLWMAFASILVLPYDVANSRGSGNLNASTRLSSDLHNNIFSCEQEGIFASTSFGRFFTPLSRSWCLL